eukprot:scaffold17843_cov131-Isochrysis_galbana.AAC.7
MAAKARTSADTMGKLAIARHVLCAVCAAYGDKREILLNNMREALGGVSKALKWETCEAHKQVEKARARLSARCSWRREADEEWHALELTLAWYIPTSWANIEKVQHPPTIDLYAKGVANMVAKAQNETAEMVRARAAVKHVFEGGWTRRIQEAKYLQGGGDLGEKRKRETHTQR